MTRCGLFQHIISSVPSFQQISQPSLHFLCDSPFSLWWEGDAAKIQLANSITGIRSRATMATPREPKAANKRKCPTHLVGEELPQRTRDGGKVSRTYTSTSLPGTFTFSISNDGSVPRPRRRPYTPEERQRVAGKRITGVCSKCKISKTRVSLILLLLSRS
jgi:hypothetical protein